MSNTAFMNDPTELTALENASSLLKPDDFKHDAVKEEWRRMVSGARLNGIRELNYYMASFSRRKDSLEQWRGYGNFCIGLDARKLKLKLRRHISLYECLYTPADIRKWISEKEAIPEWTSLDDQERRAAAFNLLYIASMKYKNKHFSAEEEIRLIATSHHDWGLYDRSPEMYEEDIPIHFSPHRFYGFPIPYIKFRIDANSNNRSQAAKESEMQMKERKLKDESATQPELLPITEVIVGPMAYQKEARIACEILLSERGYKQVPVTESEIPYRGT